VASGYGSPGTPRYAHGQSSQASAYQKRY
jgi:hypothetical protein